MHVEGRHECGCFLLLSSGLGSSLCLDYGNKILNQKMWRGEEKAFLASLYIIFEYLLLNSLLLLAEFFSYLLVVPLDTCRYFF